MEISKLKLEIYDLLGILLPGLFALAIAAELCLGWRGAVLLAGGLNGTRVTLLLLSSFGIGQLVQEAGDFILKRICGPRFFKRCRDQFWAAAAAEQVRAKIKAESSLDIASVDAAFDYCLTYIGSRFAKRDTFLAISDLARSLWFLSLVALLPIALETIHQVGLRTKIWLACRGIGVVAAFSYLAWSRMVRFRHLSEMPVFNIYLAQRTELVPALPSKEDEAKD